MSIQRTLNDILLEATFIQNNDDGYVSHIQKVNRLSDELGKSLVIDYQTNNTITNKVQFKVWLQLRNIVNMYHVCRGFQRGAFFYMNDKQYPTAVYLESVAALILGKPLYSITTVPSLESIQFKSEKKNLETPACYVIDDKAKNSTTILHKLFFSRTTLDCSASIQLTNYCSILDLLKLIHGKEKGSDIFNQIFSAKENDEHNFNQLRFGAMCPQHPLRWSNFIPLYFLTGPELIIQGGTELSSLENHLKEFPMELLGFSMSIPGIEGYRDKFPEGECGAWNVVFLGLNDKNQPLFLAASNVNKMFVFTYEELISLMHNAYNHFPSKWTKDNPLNQFVKLPLKSSFKSIATLFDFEKLNLLLTDLNGFMEEMKAFCDKSFQKQVKDHGYEIDHKTGFSNLSSFWQAHVKSDHHNVDDTATLGIAHAETNYCPSFRRTQDDSNI